MKQLQSWCKGMFGATEMIQNDSRIIGGGDLQDGSGGTTW